jgi:hypothetical protein
MSKNLKIIYLVIVIICSSCWTPRCPMNSCHVKFEHIHEGGVYRGGSFITARKHWPWVKHDKYAISNQKSGDSKRKKKWKKLFDWERE